LELGIELECGIWTWNVGFGLGMWDLHLNLEIDSECKFELKMGQFIKILVNGS